MRGAFVLCGLLFCAASASGYSAAPPRSFVKPTANGKYVLVMLHPLRDEAKKEVRMIKSLEELKEPKDIEQVFPQSGLYSTKLDSVPLKPLWTCDWRVAWGRNMSVSDDGEFVVRVADRDPGLRRWVLSYQKELPEKNEGWDDAPAMHIYKSGNLIRTVTLREAFDTSRFSTRDCFMGPIVAIDSFDDATGRVVISTEVNESKRTATVAFRDGTVVPNEGGAAGDDGAGGRNWWRTIGIGVVVVGALFAVFLGLAALILRAGRGRAAG
jgi:hypothetical protein